MIQLAVYQDNVFHPLPNGRPGQVLTITGSGLPAWVRSHTDFANLPIETGEIAGVIVTGEGNPDGGQVTLLELADAMLSLAPEGEDTPDVYLVLRNGKLEQYSPTVDVVNEAIRVPIDDPVMHQQGTLIGGLRLAESNDIIPRVGPNGALYFLRRSAGATGRITELQRLPANAYTAVNYTVEMEDDSHSGVSGGFDWKYIVPMAGTYHISFGAICSPTQLAGPENPGSPIRQALYGYLVIDGKPTRLGSYSVQYSCNDSMNVTGSISLYLETQQKVSFWIFPYDSFLGADQTLIDGYFSIVRG